MSSEPSVDTGSRFAESGSPSEQDYLHIIAQFPRYAERGWHDGFDGDPETGYFADRSSGENGIRTNANFLFVAAFLASTEPQANDRDGDQKALMLKRAKQCLNYLLGGHCCGSRRCADGGQWGGGWQSSWWATKLALGADLIWPELDQGQQQAVEELVAFEADRHLTRVVPTGLAHDTKAEENAWDAEILATAVALFPAHVHAHKWQEKLIEFNLNTLSAPQDRLSTARVSGQVLSEAVYTANVHSDFSVENHGSSHFCYIASPMLSVSWSYYALMAHDADVPEALFHHVEDFWCAAKPTFLGNRFAYISGKDWARYTYGLYFILPVLVMLQGRFGDKDARNIEIERFKSLAAEHGLNDDGSFYGKRVSKNIFGGQNAKYETDCYAMFVLSLLLHRRLATKKEKTEAKQFQKSLLGVKVSPETQTCYASFDKFFASFSWSTLECAWPIALFVPRGMDDIVEWEANNLVGRVRHPGEAKAFGVRSAKRVGDGIVVSGLTFYRQKGKEIFQHEIDMNITPDGVDIDSKITAKSRFVVLQCEALSLHLVNDVFNGFQRTYHSEAGSKTVVFDPEAEADPKHALMKKVDRYMQKVDKALGTNTPVDHFGSPWINVDDRFGVIRRNKTGEGFYLKRPAYRNTPAGCLHYDILLGPGMHSRPFFAEAGQVLVEERVTLIAGSAEETRLRAEQMQREADAPQPQQSPLHKTAH